MQNRPLVKLRHGANHGKNVPLTEFLYLYSPRVCTGTYLRHIASHFATHMVAVYYWHTEMLLRRNTFFICHMISLMDIKRKLQEDKGLVLMHLLEIMKKVRNFLWWCRIWSGLSGRCIRKLPNIFGTNWTWQVDTQHRLPQYAHWILIKRFWFLRLKY